MKTILAYCDSLCEPNPGKMEGGIWAKDDQENVLFMENISLGHGTCNEAEYYALIGLLAKLKTIITGNPKITIHSDSQLMTKQLNGLWKVTNKDIKVLYRKVMAVKDQIPFDLKWIPRENNSIADAIAQENRLKDSGRQAMMEDGRFKAKKYTPCVELLSDKAMARILYNPELVDIKNNIEGILTSARPNLEEVEGLICEMQEEVEKMRGRVPHINNLADKWVNSTLDLLRETLNNFSDMAKINDPLLKDAVSEFFFASEEDGIFHHQSDTYDRKEFNDTHQAFEANPEDEFEFSSEHLI